MNHKLARVGLTFVCAVLFLFFLFPFLFAAEAATVKKINSGSFQLEFSGRGLSSLRKTADIYPTDYVLGGNVIGDVIVSFKPAGQKDYLRLKDAELKQAGPERLVYRLYPPYQSFLSRVRITASTQARFPQVLIDDLPVVDSKSRSGGYLAFSGRKGTTEWVQYDFPEPASVSAAEVYWLDDSELNGPYKVPVKWQILYRDSRGNFVPARNLSPYETGLDRFNRVTLEPVRTTSVRLEMQLQPTHSAGLYRWRLETDAERKVRQAYEQQKRRVEKLINVESVFEPRGEELLWTINLENLTGGEIEVADLGLPLPFNTQYGWDKEVTYNLRVIRHFLVAGQGSFVFCQRTNAEPPYLLLIPVEGSGTSEAPGQGSGASAGGRAGQDGRAGKLSVGVGGPGPGFEYYDDGGRGIFCPYIHSRLVAAEARARGGRWRFPSTSVVLKPRGRPGSRVSYSFKFLWAEKGYQSVRDLLYREGKFDVQVVPGMVVPENLEALVAVRTGQKIVGLEPEFPAETEVEEVRPTSETPERGDSAGPQASGGYRIFRIKFRRLGENLVTLRCASGSSLPLEFFVTEDLETLFKKRAAFLVKRQQHRDPSKWYYGVYSDWDMKNRVLRSADDRDGLQTWLVDACDDAGNARPAFVASKNVFFPDQEEVASVDLYIKHYLWGGMQMTEDEPYPFAIYGIPNWKVNRESPDPGRNGRKHIWRIYDYPHIVLLYYRMYQVARLYPGIKTELAAEEYLRRAYRTAIAYFTVPLEVEGWSAYGTPTMNEIVMNELIEALEREGWKKEAAELRQHWEKKVLHFVNDEPYLFGSEFAFDSTGFEATGAMARYALKRLEERPGVEAFSSKTDRDRVEKFLEKQLRLNVAARGWLETAYYYLGSDYRAGGGLRYTLSYMSQMGGWSVLDYALWWAKDRQKMFDHLRLGYASYLSSWALLNSGRPDTNYGYWYPGPENDGAAGGGFEPLAWARGWNGKWVPRGSWNYSAEEDVGYCGAVRAAATVVAEDPVFGLVALGGKLVDGRDEDSAKGAGNVEASSWPEREAGLMGRAEARYDLRANSTTEIGECPVRPAEKEKNRVDTIKIKSVHGGGCGGKASSGCPEKEQGDLIRVIPRDGLRVRFHYVRDERRRWHLELEKGRLARERPVVLARDLSEISFEVEAAGAGSSEVVAVVSGLPGEYEATDGNGRRIGLERLPGGELRLSATAGQIHLHLK
ncbi:MAG: DUF5695 domain-containing protein [Candidatus Saccharicenans sp.]|nr:DUF5695 domain-containing protein [Candidatus Saccharicenans sp.]